MISITTIVLILSGWVTLQIILNERLRAQQTAELLERAIAQAQGNDSTTDQPLEVSSPPFPSSPNIPSSTEPTTSSSNSSRKAA